MIPPELGKLNSLAMEALIAGREDSRGMRRPLLGC